MAKLKIGWPDAIETDAQFDRAMRRMAYLAQNPSKRNAGQALILHDQLFNHFVHKTAILKGLARGLWDDIKIGKRTKWNFEYRKVEREYKELYQKSRWGENMTEEEKQRFYTIRGLFQLGHNK